MKKMVHSFFVTLIIAGSFCNWNFNRVGTRKRMGNNDFSWAMVPFMNMVLVLINFSKSYYGNITFNYNDIN